MLQAHLEWDVLNNLSGLYCLEFDRGKYNTLCVTKANANLSTVALHRQTWARGLVLSMEKQAGATELCLNVKPTTLLPGCNKIQYVRVRTQALMVPGLLHTPVPLTGAPEAMSRALHCILATIFFALYL